MEPAFALGIQVYSGPTVDPGPMEGLPSPDGPPAHARLLAMQKGHILGSIGSVPVLGIKLLFIIPVAINIVRCPH